VPDEVFKDVGMARCEDELVMKLADEHTVGIDWHSTVES
jgi:hypothetical protein